MSFEKRQLEELQDMLMKSNLQPDVLPIFYKMMNIIMTMQLDIDFFKQQWFAGKNPN